MSGDRTAVAQLLQGRRERAGYSRVKLGELLEISSGTIEGWELGRVERPPFHDVLRVAEVLRISHDDLVAAVTADSAGIPPEQDVPSRLARTAKPRKPLGPISLLEAAFRLFRWKGEIEAAAALNVNPDLVRRWRRGSELMNVVDYVSLAAVVSLGIAEAMKTDDLGELDLSGATESLGLRMAEA